MDSRLDSFFRTLPRHTESADSWMGIRRQEKDDGNQKKHDEKQEKEKPVWEDETVVSVVALQQFLQGLIGAPPVAPVESTRPATPATKAQTAAQAYQTRAGASPAPATPVVSATQPLLDTEETRAIHRLLNDLEILSSRGVSVLKIVKSGTFLESLSKSARQALE